MPELNRSAAVTEDQIRAHALARIAEVYGRPVNGIQFDMKFAEHFRPTVKPGLFRDNEADLMYNDIHDVSDARINKEFADGVLEIVTVGDYCEHMIRCYRFKPEDVVVVLKLPGWEQLAGLKGALRSLWSRFSKAER